jgi:hypothetical protein
MSSNFLYVEGSEDLHVVNSIMKAHVEWNLKEPWTVSIKDCGGVDKMLAKLPGRIETAIKADKKSRLGIITDADNDIAVRFSSIQKITEKYFPQISNENLTDNGVHVNNEDGARLGIWIMPDNVNSGTLETLIERIIPVKFNTLWEYAQSSTEIASSEKGAMIADANLLKSKIYCYAAWGVEADQRIGTQIMKGRFEANSEKLKPFIDWMKNLYSLTPL